MAVSINQVALLKELFLRVVERANSHAQSVNEIIYPLLSFILLIIDEDSDIQMKASEGDQGNMLWLTTNGHRYAFRYEDGEKSIVIRKGNFTGPKVASVNNSTSTNDLKVIFSQLSQENTDELSTESKKICEHLSYGLNETSQLTTIIDSNPVNDLTTFELSQAV